MIDPQYSGKSRGSSKTASKGSSSSAGRKARKKKKRPTSSSSRSSQNAGQPSGPSPESSFATSSDRSRSSRSKRSAAAAVEQGDVDRRTSTRSRSFVGGGGVGEFSSSSCGVKCASYTVGALHGIDICLGIILIVYGAMVGSVTSIMGACIAYGLILSLGAFSGAIGYYSGACNRRGLRASAIAGFLAALLDIAAFVAVVVSWPAFIAFLNDNHEALMLTKEGVKTIEGLKIFFAIIFILLAGLEVHRGLAMWGMKDNMSDTGARVSPLTRSSSDSSERCCGILSFFGLTKRKKTDDFVMFDDNASMESSLLWSKNGAQATSDDYLEFVPEHERGLANFTSNVALPIPQPDRTDY